MNHLTAENLKKPCAFIIRIIDPLQTLKSILDYLSSRKIGIETLQMHALDAVESVIILYCMVERDRIKYTKSGLEKLDGIVRLELLESKALK